MCTSWTLRTRRGCLQASAVCVFRQRPACSACNFGQCFEAMQQELKSQVSSSSTWTHLWPSILARGLNFADTKRFYAAPFYARTRSTSPCDTSSAGPGCSYDVQALTSGQAPTVGTSIDQSPIRYTIMRYAPDSASTSLVWQQPKTLKLRSLVFLAS